MANTQRKLLLSIYIAALASTCHGQGAGEAANLEQRFPGWREAVKTDNYKSWLAQQPADVAKLVDSPRSEDAILLLRYYSKYRYETQPEGYFMLACAVEQLGDFTFSVDPLLVQVNGFAAKINNTSISFERNDSLWEISRTTGSIRVRGGSPGRIIDIYNGHCRKTTLQDRKF